MQKKTVVKHKFKTYFISFLAIFLMITSFFLIYSSLNIKTSSNVALLTYSEKSNLDYKVYLKKNDYFKEKVQEGNESNKSVVTTFRIYNNLISDSLRIILAISIIVLIVIIGILKNSLLSLIKVVGIDLVITAILSILIVTILNFIIISVADLAITVNYSYGLIYGVVALVIGIIMIVSSNIYKKKMS